MALPAVKFATYEDLFDLPEQLVGEIIAGRLVTHPRSAPKHARVYLRIREAFENRDGRWLLLAVLENDAAVSQPPFDAIGFPLASLWAQ